MFYTLLKNYLETACYALSEAQDRIDYAVARGRIGTEEAAELSALAAAHDATPALSGQISALRKKLSVYRDLTAWAELEEGTSIPAGATVLFDGNVYMATAATVKSGDTSPAELSDFRRV